MNFPSVLLLTNTPAPYRMPVFAELAKQVDLTVLYCENTQPDRFWKVDLSHTSIAHEYLPSRTVRLPGMRLTINPNLARRLNNLHFDIAIAGENFSHFPAVITLNRAARRRKVPFALWSGAIDTAYASGNFLSNLYRRWLYGRTQAFLTYGSAATRFLQRRGVPAHKIVPGRQVVPAEQIFPPTQSREELGLANKQVVLYVGYLNDRKGLPTLLKAFQRVAKKDDRLILIGDGPEKATLQQMAQGDDRIQFPGYLEGAEKSSWYAASDIFVLPTRHDPWGLVVNEAMSFGLPIITTEAAG